MNNFTPGLAYLTEEDLETIIRLAEAPIDSTLKDYLMAEFGKHGNRRRIAEEQEAAYNKCENDGSSDCCGFCTPYRGALLLQEIVDVIRGYRNNAIDITQDPRSYLYDVYPENCTIPF